MEPEQTNIPREPQETETAPQADPVATQETLTETPLLAPVPFYHKKSFWIGLIVVVIIFVGLYFVFSKGASSVAEVNGMKITQEEFDESLSLIQQSAALQGINLADLAPAEAIKTQALDVLINNALLITAAQAAGITASGEEIDEKYNELVAEVGDADTLATKMAEVGLTEEKLRKNIEDRILADKYIESVTSIEDVTVSDEDILEFYNSIPDDGREIPAFETVKDELGTGLKLQKQQAVLESVLEDLRNTADIEINI